MNRNTRMRHELVPLVVIAATQAIVFLLLRGVGPFRGEATMFVLHASVFSLSLGAWILWRAIRDGSAEVVPDRTRSGRGLLLLPASVFVLGLGLTSLAVYRTCVHNEEMARVRFDRLTDRVTAETERRVDQIAFSLQGARGVFRASEVVRRDEFVEYARVRDFHAEFPGALGIGFIKRVAREDLAAFIERERADGAPDFEVRTSGAEPDLYVITVIEPDDRNMAAWGFDVGSEPNRRAAVELAVRSGEPTLSSRLTLVQDDRQRPGFLFLLPVYRNGERPATPLEREAALVGLVFSPLVIDDVLEPVVRAGELLLDVDVFDGLGRSESRKIYDSNGDQQTRSAEASERTRTSSMFTLTRPLNVGGRTWTLSFSTLPAFDAGVERGLPVAVGVGGVILSLLSGGVVWSLATGRARSRSLAARMTQDLAAAKARAENALRQFEALRQTLNQHAIVSVADGSGRIVDMNDAFCEISGYSREELVGQDHRIINSGHHPKSFWVDMWRTVAAGKPWRADVCNRAKDGSLYWVDSIIAPFRGADGRIEQLVSIRSDITQRKRFQSELVEKNREMEQFVYTASHDLKSPIVTILGYMRHLHEDLEAGRYEELPDYAMRVRRAAERMRTSVDDLLDFSRVGRASFNPEHIHLETFVRELVEGFGARLEERGIEVTTDLMLETAWFDPGHLTHLLQNLLENAIQYGCTGATKRIEVLAQSASDGSIEIRVRDHGEGIPVQHRERVFGLFQRLSSDKAGTGVGLAIVRRIAQRNGGSATIEDTPGGGVTVLLRLRTSSAQPASDTHAGESHVDQHELETNALSAR